MSAARLASRSCVCRFAAMALPASRCFSASSRRCAKKTACFTRRRGSVGMPLTEPTSRSAASCSVSARPPAPAPSPWAVRTTAESISSSSASYACRRAEACSRSDRSPRVSWALSLSILSSADLCAVISCLSTSSSSSVCLSCPMRCSKETPSEVSSKLLIFSSPRSSLMAEFFSCARAAFSSCSAPTCRPSPSWRVRSCVHSFSRLVLASLSTLFSRSRISFDVALRPSNSLALSWRMRCSSLSIRSSKPERALSCRESSWSVSCATFASNEALWLRAVSCPLRLSSHLPSMLLSSCCR
mmetsp:Transcript_6109/g.13335  ORF Transcript_6109/g.13335 Transcript_6109/m.13335 type:complete len:300 (-) Transcript_6109:823-1722(-)